VSVTYTIDPETELLPLPEDGGTLSLLLTYAALDPYRRRIVHDFAHRVIASYFETDEPLNPIAATIKTTGEWQALSTRSGGPKSA
jgi:hypothetical protein